MIFTPRYSLVMYFLLDLRHNIHTDLNYKLTTSEVLQIVRHNSSLGLIMDCFNSYDFEKVRNMCFRSKK